MYDNEFETKENKIWTKDNTNHNTYTHVISVNNGNAKDACAIELNNTNLRALSYDELIWVKFNVSF